MAAGSYAMFIGVSETIPSWVRAQHAGSAPGWHQRMMRKTEQGSKFWGNRRKWVRTLVNSRADDSSAPFEMSIERALNLLGVAEGASFDDILKAKNSILASCNGDQEEIDKVEAAYDTLLMQSLIQRKAGRVVNGSIRYADLKPVRTGASAMPGWLPSKVENAPVLVEAPTTGSLGIQAGVYGALMIFTYINGLSASSGGTYSAAEIPGLILATGFGASIYFLTKKNIDLGKASAVTLGSLIVGAVVGYGVEKWLHVDMVPFLGINSPSVVMSEFILFSQLLVSLYLR